MTNVFKDEKTLGAELIRFYRQHTGQPIERFFKFILAPHLLKLMAKKPRKPRSKKEPEKKVEKKGKTK